MCFSEKHIIMLLTTLLIEIMRQSLLSTSVMLGMFINLLKMFFFPVLFQFLSSFFLLIIVFFRVSGEQVKILVKGLLVMKCLKGCLHCINTNFFSNVCFIVPTMVLRTHTNVSSIMSDLFLKPLSDSYFDQGYQDLYLIGQKCITQLSLQQKYKSQC